jgi:hypothetical protein
MFISRSSFEARHGRMGSLRGTRDASESWVQITQHRFTETFSLSQKIKAIPGYTAYRVCSCCQSKRSFKLFRSWKKTPGRPSRPKQSRLYALRIHFRKDATICPFCPHLDFRNSSKMPANRAKNALPLHPSVLTAAKYKGT